MLEISCLPMLPLSSAYVSPTHSIKLFAMNCGAIVYVCLGEIDWTNTLISNVLYQLDGLVLWQIFVFRQWCLANNFRADTLMCINWSAHARSWRWHLAASELGLRVISHRTGVLATLHHSYPAPTSVFLTMQTNERELSAQRNLWIKMTTISWNKTLRMKT